MPATPEAGKMPAVPGTTMKSNDDGVYSFWPVRLDRASASEAGRPDAARVLENVDVDVGGRIRRRLGSSPCSGVDVCGYNVNSSFFTQRGDGTGMLFDADTAGHIRVSLAPAPAWTDGDDFGVGDQFMEMFNEERE